MTRAAPTPGPVTIASSPTPTPTGGNVQNALNVTAQATAATFAAPSGSPSDGNTVIIRVKDNGTSQPLRYNAIYRPIDVVMPDKTVAGKLLYMACRYNSQDARWDCLAVGRES